MADPFDPFASMTHEDFLEALKVENWKQVYTRLHTPSFEAFLEPEPRGRLLLVFPDGTRFMLGRNGVEALTRFLDQYANVQPLPAPDEDIFKDFKPTKVEE